MSENPPTNNQDDKKWLFWRLQVLGVQRSVRRYLWERIECRIADHDSTAGGGSCWFGHGVHKQGKTLVYLETMQGGEAPVHEAGHAWWYEIQRTSPDHKEGMRQAMLKAFQVEANKPLEPFPWIRGKCREWMYGDSTGKTLWLDEHNRWDHDEIWAGLCSACLGDLSIVPPSFVHGVLDQFFYNYGAHTTYTPGLQVSR